MIFPLYSFSQISARLLHDKITLIYFVSCIVCNIFARKKVKRESKLCVCMLHTLPCSSVEQFLKKASSWRGVTDPGKEKKVLFFVSPLLFSTKSCSSSSSSKKAQSMTSLFSWHFFVPLISHDLLFSPSILFVVFNERNTVTRSLLNLSSCSLLLKDLEKLRRGLSFWLPYLHNQ